MRVEGGRPSDYAMLRLLLQAGERISFEAYRGKVLLIVNISPNCPQTALNYTQLQRLFGNFHIILDHFGPFVKELFSSIPPHARRVT